MGSALPLSLCLLALLQASHQTTWEEGGAAISQDRRVLEKAVRESLKVINPHPTLLEMVSEELDKLEAAGKRDMRAISEFKGPGDKDLAIAESIKFWRGKMKLQVDDMINDPESYRGVSYPNRGRKIEPDPVNQSPAYLKAEAQINSLAEKASADLDKRLNELMKDGPKDFSEVTIWSYRRFGFEDGVKGTKHDIRNYAQRAKVAADRGQAEEGIQKFKDFLKKSRFRFEDAVNFIFKHGLIPK